MAETGWPLIPREVLPAPVAAVRRAKRAPVHIDGGRQLSIFGAETTDPSPADLAGLLAGPGRIGRMGGTARVSVTVDAAWRVHVLVGELVARGLVVSWLPIEQEEEPEQEPEPEIKSLEIREIGVPRSNDDPGGHTEPDAPDGSVAAGAPGGIDSADDGIADDDVPGDDRRSRGPRGAGEGDDRRSRGQRGGAGDGAGRRPRGRRGGAGSAGDADRSEHGDEEPASSAAGAAGAAGADDSADGELDRGGSTRDARDRPGAAPAFVEVRTAYSSRLSGLARAWPPPPDRLFLSGPRLRLWVAAAGEPRPGGYALRLDPVDNPEIADSALVRAGLAGTVSDQGLHYLISGKKRLRRLAELVGERPAAAPAELWPGGAAA